MPHIKRLTFIIPILGIVLIAVGCVADNNSSQIPTKTDVYSEIEKTIQYDIRASQVAATNEAQASRAAATQETINIAMTEDASILGTRIAATQTQSSYEITYSVYKETYSAVLTVQPKQAQLIYPLDGMVMVFVPAGSFQMGNNSHPYTRPEHTVVLDAFWIDQTEVTNAMYKKCVEAKICNPPVSASLTNIAQYYGNSNYDKYPVLNVARVDAFNYCIWLKTSHLTVWCHR